MDPEAEAAALRAQVEEQRGAIEDLKSAFKASEERQRASQAEIIAKLSQLVVEKSEGESGGPCLLYTSPSPRDATLSRMPSSA